MPNLRKVNAAANNLITTDFGEVNWPSVAWLHQLETQNEVLKKETFGFYKFIILL
jgi:hypothetical protein